MIQPQLITSTLVWERKLQIEEQEQKSRRFEDDFTNNPNGSSQSQQINKSLFTRILGLLRNSEHAFPGTTQEQCCDTQ